MSLFDLGVRADLAIPMVGGKSTTYKNYFLGIKGDLIMCMRPFSGQDKSACHNFIDGKGKVLLPGLVNGHTHLPMTLLRGFEDDLVFEKWLFERILPVESALMDEAFVRAGTKLAALECIRFGVTTVADMYYFPEVIADTWDKAGLRGIISQVFASIPLPEDKKLGSDKLFLFESFFSKYKDHSRIKAGLGPHAPYTCDDKVLNQVARLSDKFFAPIHIHVSETKKEVQDSLAQFGKTPVQRLVDLGVLRQGALAAHCVHLSENDIELFKSSKASVIYNPDSNMKLSSGAAPVRDYLERGISVALGTDGAASNNNMSIFNAMNVGTKLQKLAAGVNTAMVASQALNAATLGGARALGLGDKIGSLEQGKQADFILLDLEVPHLQPVHDVVSHLVYSCSGLEVDTVVCAGKVLMQEKRFQYFDSEEVFSEARIQADRIRSLL